jgi:predicted DNA-binding transcriptional regulator AlpA
MPSSTPTTSTPQDLPSTDITPELLRPAEAARLIGCGVRSLWRWSRSGAAPAPVRIGGTTVRYRASELREWIARGCPRVDNELSHVGVR